MKLYIFLFCLFSVGFVIDNQDIGGNELLNKSIAYHDKGGKWDTTKSKMILLEQGAGSEGISCAIEINNKEGIFRHSQIFGTDNVLRKVAGGKCSFMLNGSAKVSNEDFEKYKLNCERTKLFRNYYSYLWGLPMKLKDIGTKIHDDVQEVTFEGKKCYQLKVTYDPSVGDDIWYFYFDKDTYALKGYRFYHDELRNDGEYIVLSGEVDVNGMIIPKRRKWFVNRSDKFLGTDILLKAEKIKKKEYVNP